MNVILKRKNKNDIFEKMLSPNTYRPPRDDYEKEEWQDDWKKTGENTWSRTSQERLNSSQESVNNGYYAGQRSRAERSLTGQEAVWKIKADRTDVENRYAAEKNVVSLTITVLAVLGTILKADFRIQIMLYVIWFAVIILADPLGAIGRFLSLPIRIMVAASCFSIILAFSRRGVDTLLLSVTVIGSTGCCVKFLNNSWLAAENWKNTKAVQNTLRQDPKSMAAKNWQAIGRRETKTLLNEMGMAADDDTLDVFHKATFELGYNNGLKKMGQINATKDKLYKVNQENKIYKERIEELEHSLEFATEDKEKYRAANDMTNYWRQKYIEMEKINEQIITANEELQKMMQEEKEETIHLVDEPETIKDKVLYARNTLKLSYEKSGKYAGCSKGTAYNIIKEAEKEEQVVGL